MIRFIRGLQLQQYAFWLGFLAGCLFWWFQGKFRAGLPRIISNLKARAQMTRQSIMAGTEARYRKDVLRAAQHMHLAAPLFSLDEIYIPPLFVAPPARHDPDQDIQEEENALAFSLPYMPDMPGLAATYHAPHLTLTEALKGGANLILIGGPGSGKTVALAYLASQVARQQIETGDLKQYLPILVHAADLAFAPSDQNRLDTLVDAAAAHVSALTLPRLPVLIRSSLENNRALLLLDGLDELPPDQVNKVVDLLGWWLEKYPSLRVAATASYEYFDGLAALGMAPLAISAWTLAQRNDFVELWSRQWSRFVTSTHAPTLQDVDPLLMNGWLINSDHSYSPLENTLKLWAAYAGDALGPSPANAIEAYLLRMTVGVDRSRPALETLAMQMICSLNTAVTAKEAEKWVPASVTTVSPFEAGAAAEGTTGQPAPSSETELVEPEKKRPGKASAQEHTPVQRILFDLSSSGLLVNRKDGRLSLVHPTITGYLAGHALASSGNITSIANQPEWAGKTLALRYLASVNDLTEQIAPSLEQKDDPLFRKLMSASQWLRDAPKNVRWRPLMMRRLVAMMQHEMLAMGLRMRAMCALAYSGDSGVALVFRQLLTNQSGIVRQLAALGCGLLRDTKSVNDLIALLNDPEPEVSQAAIMALATISDRTSLDAIAATLLHGSEAMRRIAAEALAFHPEEGHPALQDGSSMDDLLVRRAVVHGLVKVGEPWAIQILEKMQIEDGQWVVRNAATMAMAALGKPNLYIPRPLPALTETPWLVMYAAGLGVGVSPGKPALELLLQALKSGNEQQRLAALDYISLKGDEGFIPAIYHILFGSKGEIREAAFNTLWYLGAAGVKLPSPTQFGLG
ncbi:MAG: HEAT repeat domain-containing protein [Chloroflexota bacterium]|nr:MAG: HEAT repeat domain-containing protein [Chloroflexota bacterium]